MTLKIVPIKKTLGHISKLNLAAKVLNLIPVVQLQQPEPEPAPALLRRRDAAGGDSGGRNEGLAGHPSVRGAPWRRSPCTSGRDGAGAGAPQGAPRGVGRDGAPW
jgi:hypothetical protein